MEYLLTEHWAELRLEQEADIAQLICGLVSFYIHCRLISRVQIDQDMKSHQIFCSEGSIPMLYVFIQKTFL